MSLAFHLSPKNQVCGKIVERHFKMAFIFAKVQWNLGQLVQLSGEGIPLKLPVLHTHQMVNILSLGLMTIHSESGMQKQEWQWVSH